jgi:plastocyanin
MRTARTVVLVAILALSVTLAAGVALGATKRVGVRKSSGDWRFSPSSVSIRKGDTVRWSWRGRDAHNVKGPGFQSRTARRLTYSRRFSRAGRFRIVCTIHSNTQKMTVRVR